MSSSSREDGISGRGGQPSGVAIPESIGRYKIHRLIGKGGQGNVYLAYDPNLEIDVAIKVLHQDYRAEEFIDRFKVEARTAVRLAALNVVRVYDFDPEFPYLVMEYCGDGDLNRYIKTRHRRPLAELLSITRQICDALVAAHENRPSILHRDLKPGNVLFQKNVPKVADFGLAKMLGGGGSGLTTTRGVMGTVRYCSPEQLRDASKVDHRSDLWSVGVILYELLTWVRPFDKPDDTFVNIALRVHTEPPREPPYPIPGPVMAVVRRALEKDPAQRYGSAREMIAGIDEALRAMPDADRILLPPAEMIDEQSRLAAEVADLLEQGKAADASTLATRIRKVAPEDSLVRFWEHRLREIRSDIVLTPSDSGIDTEQRKRAEWLEKQYASIQSFIHGRSYRDARRLIGEILVQDPDNTIAQRWLDRVNEEEKRLREDLDRSHKDADLWRSKSEFRKVHDIWREMADRYPDLQEIQAELAVSTREMEVQEQQRLRETAAAEAGKLQGAGDLAGAAAAWKAYTAVYPADQEAARALQKIVDQIRARERAAKLAAAAARAGELRGAADLQGALEVWETLLREDPTCAEAGREIEALRREIAALGQARRLQEARSRAEACAGSGDLGGAIRSWERFLADYPEHTEARQQHAALKQRAAEEQRRALALDVEALIKTVAERIAAHRYQGLAGMQEKVTGAAGRARAALDKDAKALAAARVDLSAVHEEAEAALAREQANRRARLQERIQQSRDWLSPQAGLDGSARPPAEQALERKLSGALAALCSSPSRDAVADPLEPLARADKELAEAAAALAAQRRHAVEEAGALAAMEIAEARKALEALQSALAGAPGADSASETESLKQRLARLEAEARSQVPERLSAVAQEAATLKSEAGAACLAVCWRMSADLRARLQEALAMASQAGRPKLEDLAQRVGQALESPDGAAPASADRLAALSRELDKEMDAARVEIERREEAARARWKKSLADWGALLSADFKAHPAGEGERMLARGEAALAARRIEELEGWAAQLEGLTRRYRLESVWIEQNDAVVQVEGALGPDGLPMQQPASEDEDLLAAYRKAVARGDGAAARALGPKLKDRRSRPAKGAEAGPARTPGQLPDLSAGVRRLNERYNKAALDSFDQMTSRYKSSLSQGKKGEAWQLAVDIERAHRRLLRPPPAWKRALVPAAAVLAVAAALVLWPGSPVGGQQTFKVAVVSAGGPVSIDGVTRDRTRFDVPSREISEAGAVWDLPAGHFAVTVQGGGSIEFDVPGQTTVLLPAAGMNFSNALLQELDLKKLLESP